MKKLTLVVVGASGKMGQEILSAAEKHKAVAATIAISSSTGGIASLSKPKNAVVVDFSTPAGFMSSLDWCLKNKVPFVSGTTGLSPEQKKQLPKAAKKTAVLWAPNMSRGVHIFARIIEGIGKNIKDYNLQIEEAHHIHNVDAPSGTAKMLQETAEKATRKKLPPIISVREGEIFGTHKLTIKSAEETLVVEHIAHNRGVFAQGAVEAAVWLSAKKKGLFEMRDVMGG